MNTTDTMEYALARYAELETFDSYDPTIAMLAGTLEAGLPDMPEAFRGLALAAQLRMAQRHALIDLRRA
jgi:hypothetical protein